MEEPGDLWAVLPIRITFPYCSFMSIQSKHKLQFSMSNNFCTKSLQEAEDFFFNYLVCK